MSDRVAEGPWFEDLELGQVFSQAPAVTLTEGMAAQHQAIVGNRLHLCLDRPLGAEVTGQRSLASPALVWDVAIGQSTVATHHVRANLFYRGLRFLSTPAIGDTVRTVTDVVGLKQNARRPDRPATGLAALRIRTTDAVSGREILDFHRCAMIPLRDPGANTGRTDDLSGIGISAPSGQWVGMGWTLERLAERAGTARDLPVGRAIEVAGGDVVSSAPELARLTMNIASVHHDRFRAGGTRLVYGGHTIGVALAQVTRALPFLATVVSWEGCDHLAPVHEDDTLSTVVHIERVEPVGAGFHVQLRAAVTARAAHKPAADVLDWRFTALSA